MFMIASNFISSFKIGDNINHNFAILGLLYDAYEVASPDDRRRLCKPITVTLVSIIEACLYDFHRRAKLHTWEGVVGLANTALEHMRIKQIDDLEQCIASAKKHKLFGSNAKFYEDLDVLRLLRNRVHIQNRSNKLEPDEWNAFTQQRKVLAEKALEKIAKTLAMKHPRPEHIHGHVSDFQCPWDEHFPQGL
jgi:hypothetical protein